VLHRPLVAVLAALAALAVAAPGQAATPKRIVSLSATATESLFAIGAGPQVVAVDERSDYPKQAPRTKLSGLTPNVEAIVSYRPDLVVIAYDPGGLRNALEKLHIRVLEQDAPKTFAGAYAQIRRLGALTGHRARASRLVASMRTRIAKLVAGAHGRGTGLTVYHELDPTLYSLTSDTFAGRVYGLFGMKNVADEADRTGTGYPQLSSEYLVSRSPDLIVLADTVCCGQSRATLAKRPGWSTISAVRTGQVVRLDDSIASRWGPRIVNFVRAIARALTHVRLTR
jgi:iron complex transport system substrate-binding protein